jgi:flagellar motility protein MotE (MotC chaperone)
VSKKLIIITALAGLVSFTGAFVLGWLTKLAPSEYHDGTVQPEVKSLETIHEIPHPVVDMSGTIGTVSGGERTNMTEKQLKNLVFEVREKVKEYNNKLQDLALREERLQKTQDTLKQDIQKLKDLRVELATIIADIKSERDKLLKSRLEIDQNERDNLVLIAASYDKMDSASASKILVTMCSPQTQPGEIDNHSSGFDEAVKILYYMTDRTKAKLLAELTTTEPKLAAFLTQKLKHIVEGK